MIKKEHRLKKNFQFSYIYKHGESVKTKNLVCVFTKTKRKPFKVGFSVGKNVGKSVVRSLVKRRMTECFNKYQQEFPDVYNYVFIARDGAKDISFFEMLSEFEAILKKIN